MCLREIDSRECFADSIAFQELSFDFFSLVERGEQEAAVTLLTRDAASDSGARDGAVGGII